MAVEDLTTWYWTGNTEINSINIDNVDFDDDLEIITGGFFTNSDIINAQMVTWAITF